MMVEELVIKDENADFLPNVKFNAKSGVLEFSGLSRVESITSFQKVLDWIDEYIKNPASQTLIKCDFSYVNSATSKVLMNIFLEFQEIENVKVEWLIDSRDIDLEDLGKMYKEILDIDFTIIEKK